MPPYIQLHRTVNQHPAGEILLVEQTPRRFLEAMDVIWSDLLTGNLREENNLRYCAYTADGRFIGTMMVRSSGFGPCIASPRKSPWFTDKGDWMLRAFLAGSDLIRSNFYVGYCRRGWNYGMMRMFKRMGLGGVTIFQGHSVMTAMQTNESVADLDKYISESIENYKVVRSLATTRLTKFDRADVEPEFDVYRTPVWIGDVTL